MKEDEIARRNRAFWTEMAAEEKREANRYTQPWLELDRELIESFARGEIEVLPEPYTYIYPGVVLAGVKGKRVLCLAASGGQQSAVLGLLGAEVTVFDLTEKQLEADRLVARHYGYKVGTVRGDMRDLSGLKAEAYDLVYQAISVCFVPDLRQVYRQVARVTKPGGVYRVGHCHPATQVVEETSWDGEGYRICEPYRPGRLDDADAFEFRHLYSDIFNGLIENGFVIRGVWDDPRHLRDTSGRRPGTHDHMVGFVAQHFAIVSEKAAAMEK